MPTWKRILLKVVGFGAGFAIVACLVAGILNWHLTQPKPPTPWNTVAIKAEFCRLTASSDGSNLQIEYVLENTTDEDYRCVDSQSRQSLLKIAAMLQDKSDLTFNFEGLQLNCPIVIPPKQKASIIVTLPSNGYPNFSRELNKDASSDEVGIYMFRQAVLALIGPIPVSEWINQKMPNLNGFVLFDETRRYQIILPPGWKKK
jgi:hypothetical protein